MTPPAALEAELQRYALRTGSMPASAPIRDLLAPYVLTPIGGGVFHRVYRVTGTPWVVKEGRWHLSIPIHCWSFPVHARLIHPLLAAWGSGCKPTAREAQRQYEHYLVFAEYLGHFDTLPDAYPDGQVLARTQRLIRDSLPQALTRIEAYYGRRLPPSVQRIVDSPLRLHNFLPREYLLFGTSLDAGEHTSFLFQEFTEGTPLHDIDVPTLAPQRRDEMILLSVLLLLLRMETGIVPDTRPRDFLLHHDWFTKTDNILVGPHGVTMVDTRWFWESRENVIRRGIVLPEWIARCLWKYLGNAGW
ncbi:MAG: hypothetical protein G01um101425_719 [Candidatus Peregrinibacteria bacterium Gr01-1014_25]|nr:MAG: hypothetical protein G01um101425_719 [Candidatus Peregrinibacteria bacterium Gr01-1014_25]